MSIQGKRYGLAIIALAAVMTVGITATAQTSLPSPANVSVYRNADYHFSMMVPAGMTVDDEPQREGTQLSFTDPAAGHWFSVRITPYLQLNLANPGFEPQAPWNVTDQGEGLGTVNLSLSDDITIAFTKDGNYYQVFTATDFAEPMADILRTWQFTD